MSASKRVNQEPAWLLHHRPFRDTSRILDVLSRDHGRLALVARGSRSAKSRLSGLLRPFMPLSISWVIRSDLGTLTGAEINGEPISLGGDALMSGFYTNELILNFLHRHDPQPDIFKLYGDTVAALAGKKDVARDLRHFELGLLELLGYALNLDHDTVTQAPLDPAARYEYRPEQGAVLATGRQGVAEYSGAELIAIRNRQLDSDAVLQKANRLLRDVIAFHLGGKELKSRKVLLELKRNSKSIESR
jgi:DNA repair protein RecO (recombination protein O)